MKFGTLVLNGEPVVAAISSGGDQYWALEELTGKPIKTMMDLIRVYDDVKGALNPNGGARSLAGVKINAPLLPVRNVMCVGKNYHAHAHEFTKSGFDSSAKDASEAIPTAPIIFTKAPETVIATGEAIRYPTGLSDSVDYEAELGVVIGKAGRGISKAEALDHVFGYTIINDVTARDLQSKHKQWFIGKSLDTFCPMGPWLVSADEVDAGNLDLKCWVNGELRQHANTSDLIFDVPTLIETLSAGLTLQVGDVIATGTPAGVGSARTPPIYLKAGDRISCTYDGVGTLANPVVQEK